MDDSPLRLTAYEIDDGTAMPLVRASARRTWMDATPEGFANRCLPLVIANQHGWMIQSHLDFTALWNGRRTPADVQIIIHKTDAKARGWDARNYVQSHFGEGVLTFTIPYLFRTPPGYNLWVKGPANHVKDSIQALEGIIETDWLQATFTMNWKFTRPGEIIRFEIGEPICQVMPLPRGLVERFQPERQGIGANPDLASAFERWRNSRTVFAREMGIADSPAHQRGWQKDYFQGVQADGRRFEAHQTHLAVREFVRIGAPTSALKGAADIRAQQREEPLPQP